jgi:hypothetical protein
LEKLVLVQRIDWNIAVATGAYRVVHSLRLIFVGPAIAFGETDAKKPAAGNSLGGL